MLVFIFSDSNVNSKLDKFNNVLLTTLAAHAPIRIIKIKNRSCLFITTDIKNKCPTEINYTRYRRLESI